MHIFLILYQNANSQPSATKLLLAYKNTMFVLCSLQVSMYPNTSIRQMICDQLPISQQYYSGTCLLQ